MKLFISDAIGAEPAAAPDASAAATGNEAVPYELSGEKMMMDNMLVLGLLFFIFYFILIRPQQKRLKTHQAMLKSLQKGSKVMTSGGLYGSIIKFEGDDVVLLEIAQGVRVRVARSSISEVADASAGLGETANDN